MAILGGYRITRTGLLFVIGIVVLGGLVTGGIFLVKNHGEVVRHDQAVKIAEQNLKDQSKTGTQPVNTSNASDSSKPDTTNTTGADGTTNTDTTTVATTGGTTALPVTGPNDLKILGSSAVVGVLALSVAYYAASRRAVQRL